MRPDYTEIARSLAQIALLTDGGLGAAPAPLPTDGIDYYAERTGRRIVRRALRLAEGGDHAAARDEWSRVVALFPNTPAAREAALRLTEESET